MKLVARGIKWKEKNTEEKRETRSSSEHEDGQLKTEGEERRPKTGVSESVERANWETDSYGCAVLRAHLRSGVTKWKEGQVSMAGGK